MEALLSVEKLGMRLDGRELWRGLDFGLGAGETLVVLGPNGAGKTVLLKALLGLLPAEGSVRWRPGLRVGYVPQRVPLSKDLPVTVDDFFAMRGVAVAGAARALARVGLGAEGFGSRQLGLLSSGQFQRVLIAWALAGEPEVLLCDEPAAGIDLGGEETVNQLLRQVQAESGLGIILVTHDLSAVYALADRVLCLGGGAPCSGPPREVLSPERLAELYGGDLKFFRHRHG